MKLKEVKVTDTNGEVKKFLSVADCASYYCMTETAVRSRLHGGVKGEMRKFEYTGKIYSKAPHNKDSKTYKKPFNSCGADEIPYETLGTRVCITECGIMNGVKVGSVKCKCCARHRGQDRERHLVACGVNK